MVLASQLLREACCHRRIVECVFTFSILRREGDGVSADWLGCRSGHHGHYARRIQACAQEGANRHVTDQLSFNRQPEAFAEFIRQPPFREAKLITFWREGQVPVLRNSQRAVAKCGGMPGRQLVDTFEQGFRIGYPQKSKVLVQGLQVYSRLDLGDFQQRLGFGSKRQPPISAGVIERLNAEMIAGHKQQRSTAAKITDRKREHSVEAGDAPLAQFLIKMNNDFGIGVR